MKQCVVSGVSGGIGSAIATALLTASYSIIGIGRKRPAAWSGDFLECDFQSEAELQSACLSLSEKCSNLWALVNVAGQAITGSLGDVDDAAFTGILKVNAIAPAQLVGSLSKLMLNGGRIVSISSIVAAGKTNRSIYAASKAALNALSSTWALELADQGITSNAIAAGPVETSLLRGVLPSGSEAEKVLLAQIPTGRMTTPEEIAGLVCYLLSDSAGNMTGQVISMDGGLTVGTR